tara:strand:- start:15987 stop:16589 length:603 start_codon:yes stop_codon:yes gene_type:complete
MSDFKLGVLISGNGSNLQAIIDKFKDDDFIEISCVISNKENAYGLERASKENIDNFFVDHNDYDSRKDFELHLIDILERYNVDLIILAGFMRILSEYFVEKYEGKLINIHPSLLPKHKGLNTHEKVLKEKDKLHGVTVHFVDSSLDGGPICAQSSFEVDTKDVANLEEKAHQLEHQIYPRVIEEIAKGRLYLSNGKVVKE